MTNKQLFIKAHKQARLTVHLVGNYQIAFTLALKALYKPVQAHSMVGNAKPNFKALNIAKGFTGTNKPIKTVNLIDSDLSISIFISALIIFSVGLNVYGYSVKSANLMVLSGIIALVGSITIYAISETIIKLINTLTKFKYRHNDNVYFANNF